MMIKMKTKKGFTLVEIMIVVAIIGLLAAIAIPNFVRARAKAQAETCIANLRQIEGAVQVWAVDNNQPDTAQATFGTAGNASPAATDLVPNYIRTPPTCPLDPAKTAVTSYTIGIVSARPTCNVGATATPPHVLP